MNDKEVKEQEPVVFYRCNGCGHAYEQVHPTSCDCMEDGGFDRVEYYTSPPAQRQARSADTWVGLTEEEIAVIASTPCAVVGSYVHTFARAIEAKLKEKNT